MKVIISKLKMEFNGTIMNNMDKLIQLRQEIHPVLWDGGSYCFFDLTIKIEGKSTISDLINEKENASCFTTIIHEYIHFIQNFTTSFGFTNFITYVDLFAIYFGENILLDSDPIIPTENGIVDTKFGDKNFKNYIKSSFLGTDRDEYGDISFQPTSKEDFTVIESSIINPYWQKTIFISYVAYEGEMIPLNEFVVSENMAIIASYISAGISQFEANKSITKIFGAEYHIVYSFLNYHYPTKDCFKMAYIFSEISLLITPYNKTIFDILKNLVNNKTTYVNLTEKEIIDRVKKMLNFDRAISVSFKEIHKQLDNRLLIFTKYEENYGFYKYLKEILYLFKRGFNERTINNITFNDKFDSSFLNYYTGVINSPILVFLKDKRRMLGNPNNNYVNSIAIVSGVLTVFHESYSKNIVKCPFASDYSICEHTKGALCYSSPFLVFQNTTYNGCLFQNSLEILGLRKVGRV